MALDKLSDLTRFNNCKRHIQESLLTGVEGLNSTVFVPQLQEATV